MTQIHKIIVSTGIFYVDIPKADVRILCGCPADAVKHLRRTGLIASVEINGVKAETGPNAILLSDLAIQNGHICNQGEFPVLQMLYMQGMIVPGHPNNRGRLPILMGLRGQVDAQMAYIFRGNYGLTSKDELLEAGATPELADEVMRLKLAFAFGKIRPTEELLKPVYVEKGIAEIHNGVFIHRLRTNVFRIAYRDDRIDVDLSLQPDQAFECPYRLENHLLTRDYFSVVHTGDGDGWDINRPAMSCIVMFQGRVYLVDAGPNIQVSLNALGIGLEEIEGIFSTHCHDDHIGGISLLMLSDRRIKFYAVPFVRATVIKKLAPLMGASDRDFDDLFEFHDLRLDEWNGIDGLEVRPFLSPHPVETTCFQFRVFWEGGYRTYSHLADIASFRVLEGMLSDPGEPSGISPARLEQTRRDYAETAQVKMVDIGGGLIHGEARDFRQDTSGRLILAHTSRKLTKEERAIGGGVSFASIDVLIEGVSDDLRRKAFNYLLEYFPTAPLHWIRHLMNNPIRTSNPETLLIKEGKPAADVMLLVSGCVEMFRPETRGSYVLFGGSMLGETSALLTANSEESYRAISFVTALHIPHDVYYDFVIRNTLYESIVTSRPKSDFLRRCSLFGDGVTCVTLNRLVREAELLTFKAGSDLSFPESELWLITWGTGILQKPSGEVETLAVGTFVGANVLGDTHHRGTRIRFADMAQAYAFSLEAIAPLPVVRWKLMESYRRRFLGL